MDGDSLTQDQAGTFLERLVALHNAGVRSRDFSPLIDLFADDAVLEFEGVPDWGPFEGKDAIARRIYSDAPDDEIRITRWKKKPGSVCAEFVWKDIPEARGGTFVVVTRGDKIARLTMAFGGPASRWDRSP